MKKIASFTIDHTRLQRGIYVSRKDSIGGETATTIDIRVRRPNVEPAMGPRASHTVEHLGATYLRNLEGWSDRVIYFGPMGCLTGFYLIVSGDFSPETPAYDELVAAVVGMFRHIAGYEGEVPGARPEECGNCTFHDLKAAKALAADMLKTAEDGGLRFVYPQSSSSSQPLK